LDKSLYISIFVIMLISCVLFIPINVEADTADDFITSWRISEEDKSLTISVVGATGEYTIHWGDGSSDTISGNAYHAYAIAGDYTVKISGDFTRIYLNHSSNLSPNNNALKLRSIDQWGNMQWSSMHSAFEYTKNMQLLATDTPDLSRVTDMSSMFYVATSFNSDISTWDVSSVTDMSRMFHFATSFNSDTSTWDVSSVTDMSRMFFYASAFNSDISTWDVSSVTDMNQMFNFATSFNSDLCAWDVSSVTDMNRMFFYASAFNSDISTWDVSSVTDMENIFLGATSFNPIFSPWYIGEGTVVPNPTTQIDTECTHDCLSSGHSSHNTEKKKGNGGCADCTPPIFGKTRDNKWIVQDGFSFNKIATDVTNYHTEYPLITVNTNQTNNLTIKAYENGGTNNMKWVQFGLGIPEVGFPLNDAQTIVTIYLKHGEVEKIEKREKYPLVDVSNVTTSIVECGYTVSDCLQVSMDYIYRDQPKYNIMAINAMDVSRNSQTNFLNDGIEVIGESINEPLLDKISVSKGGAFYPQRAGTVELTLIDYKTDMWQDEYGYLWTGDNYKSFKIIDTVPAPIKEPDMVVSVMTRLNSNFADMIIYEQDRAVLHFDSSKLVSILEDSFAYDISKSDAEKQADLDIRIADEIKRITPMTQNYTNNQH